MFKTKTSQSAGLRFDGINDQVVFGNIPTIDLSKDNPYSVSFKIKGTTQLRFGNWFFDSNKSGWIIILTPTNLLFFIIGDLNTNDFVQVILPITPLEYSQGFTALVTYDGIDRYTFRVNNSEVILNKVIVNPTISNEPFIVDIQSTFNGDIYNIKKYDRELTLAEFNDTKLGNYPTDYVFNLPFKEAQGFFTKDTVNKYVGTIINKSIGDVTIGVTNSWLYPNGQPFDSSKFSILKT